jgi:PPE-repeat protein
VGHSRLLIIEVGPHISNVRIRQTDNLSRVTGIRENFLISGEAGIENSLSAPAGFGARGASNENSPVFQRKRGGLSDLMGQRILLNLLD